MFICCTRRSALLILSSLLFFLCLPMPTNADDVELASPLKPPAFEQWSGERAMSTIRHLLDLGPRHVGGDGHDKAADFIVATMSALPNTKVEIQRGNYREGGKADGRVMPIANIIARFQPDNPKRILVGTHYDSIIRAWRDSKTPDAVMPGANNSASGVAVILETAKMIGEAELSPPMGIDFVFFDAEEGALSLGEGDPAWLALGSEWFASHSNWTTDGTEAVVSGSPKPEKAVILDMVCDRDLKLQPEPNSLTTAMGRREAKKFWQIGEQYFPDAFSPWPRLGAIGDDHIALINAGIPAFLVMDFDYLPWYNTTQDTPDKCSAASLEAVGHTLLRYLYAGDVP